MKPKSIRHVRCTGIIDVALFAVALKVNNNQQHVGIEMPVVRVLAEATTVGCRPSRWMCGQMVLHKISRLTDLFSG